MNEEEKLMGKLEEVKALIAQTLEQMREGL